MYRFDEKDFLDETTPLLQRTRGHARVGFWHKDGRTRLKDLYQSGSAKLRLPRIYSGAPTGVLINTAGGLTGGDRMTYEVESGENTHAIVTTQTAERAYRSPAGTADISTVLTGQAASHLEWLPQETILFDHSALNRQLTANLTGSARLLCLEAVVIGRPAMGETVEQIHFKDKWRIRREGKLIYADDIRLTGHPARILNGPATADGHTAFASFIDCDPNAEDRLDLARSVIQTARETVGIAAGCSAWNGVLSARFVARDGQALRAGLTSFLTGYRECGLPRVWQT